MSDKRTSSSAGVALSDERSQVIGRALWNCLRTQGDPVERTVTVYPNSVDVDGEGTRVSVFTDDDGVDVRVGDLQFVVKGKRVVVMQQHPPYPITRWTILFEGEVGS